VLWIQLPVFLRSTTWGISRKPLWASLAEQCGVGWGVVGGLGEEKGGGPCGALWVIKGRRMCVSAWRRGWGGGHPWLRVVMQGSHPSLSSTARRPIMVTKTAATI